jgi:hypothetical protein
MRRKSSLRPLLVASALVLAFILLAAGLDEFRLASGLRIETDFEETMERAFALQEREARNYYDGALLSWVVSVVVGLSIVLFFVGLIRKESRLPTLFIVLIGAIAALLITRIPPPAEDLETAFEEGPRAPGAGDESVTTIDPLAEEDAVDVSVEREDGPGPWSWVLAGVAVAGLIAVVRPRLRLPSLRRARDDEETLDDVARTAVREAEGGDDVLQTVVRCYRDMLELYRRSRYAGRHNALTPREFAQRLVTAGVRSEDADGLTALFERARYGVVTLSPREEQAAVDHLRNIARALQRQPEADARA